MNYKTYPKGYRQIGVMDFVRNRKQLLTVNISALVVTAIMIVLGLIFRPLGPTWEFLKQNWWAWLAMAGMHIAYIILHELTHGIIMHALSGVKPKYGIKLCYAYAGSNVYFDKLSHNLIALAPLVVWGIVLFILGEALPREWFWLIYLVQISNISGSAGDVYCVLHLAKMPKDIVIQDTGTRMRILAPKPTEEESK